MIPSRNANVYDFEVRPKGEIVDLLAEVHGLSETEIMGAKYQLEDIQMMLCQICDQNTLLVGHGL